MSDKISDTLKRALDFLESQQTEINKLRFDVEQVCKNGNFVLQTWRDRTKPRDIKPPKVAPDQDLKLADSMLEQAKKIKEKYKKRGEGSRSSAALAKPTPLQPAAPGGKNIAVITSQQLQSLQLPLPASLQPPCVGLDPSLLARVQSQLSCLAVLQKGLSKLPCPCRHQGPFLSRLQSRLCPPSDGAHKRQGASPIHLPPIWRWFTPWEASCGVPLVPSKLGYSSPRQLGQVLELVHRLQWLSLLLTLHSLLEPLPRSSPSVATFQLLMGLLCDGGEKFPILLASH